MPPILEVLSPNRAGRMRREPIENSARIRAKSGEQWQIVGPAEHVDRVELKAAPAVRSRAGAVARRSDRLGVAARSPARQARYAELPRPLTAPEPARRRSASRRGGPRRGLYGRRRTTKRLAESARRVRIA